jgi:hypothetical protein
VPVVRFEPGDVAPRAGTYALTGEWGEPAGESASVSCGQRLPLVDAAQAPRWYMLVELEAAGETSSAAEPSLGEVSARRTGSQEAGTGAETAVGEVLTRAGPEH